VKPVVMVEKSFRMFERLKKSNWHFGPIVTVTVGKNLIIVGPVHRT
jgi:hypothetical protein